MTPKFKVEAIHQIELTSRCNLRCKYCVWPTMPRPKQDMPMDIYVRCLEWVRKFVERGTQRELNLCGIGESTMVPDFLERVRLAREYAGFHTALVFATNGLLITEDLAKALKPFKPLVGVSAHRPEKAGPAIEILKKHGLLSWISVDPSSSAIDWAGQVKWFVSAKPEPCPWIMYRRAFVMSDGRMSACCLDGTGDEAFGNILTFNEDTDLTGPYKLCATCNQTLDIPGYQQYKT